MIYLILTELIKHEKTIAREEVQLYHNTVFYFKNGKVKWEVAIGHGEEDYSNAWEQCCAFAGGIRLTGAKACIGSIKSDLPNQDYDFKRDMPFIEKELRQLKTYEDFIKLLWKHNYKVEEELDALSA